MTKKFQNIVYIGRFQPLHNQHLETIMQALHLAERVIVVLGSCKAPRTIKNPFTAEERQSMVQKSLEWNFRDSGRVHYAEVTDHSYDDQAWATEVQTEVSKLLIPGNVSIIGHKKDDSSFYLDMFPQWEFVQKDGEYKAVSATQIRDMIFANGKYDRSFLSGVIPTPVLDMIQEWMQTEAYANLLGEYEHIRDYKKQFESLAYPPVFVTADALVVQSGHVLLVKRRAAPGKGLWALPGGFLNANTDRSMKHAALRELDEETGIKVPRKVLEGNITGSHVFDAVDRSARGRTITHCFKIELPPGPLPKVKGSDDAEKAVWVPISEIDPEKMFEDHAQIVYHMLGIKRI